MARLKSEARLALIVFWCTQEVSFLHTHKNCAWALRIYTEGSHRKTTVYHRFFAVLYPKSLKAVLIFLNLNGIDIAHRSYGLHGIEHVIQKSVKLHIV